VTAPPPRRGLHPPPSAPSCDVLFALVCGLCDCVRLYVWFCRVALTGAM
jgi:hypothetical protein